MPSLLADGSQPYPSIPLLIVGCALIVAGAIPLLTLAVAKRAAGHGVFGGPIVYRSGESLADSQRRGERLTQRMIERRTHRKPLYWVSVLAGVVLVVVSALV